MSNVSVEVRDQRGGFIRSSKDLLTGYIKVIIFNGLSEMTDELIMDPKDPEVINWLKGIYSPIHLEMLLREAS